MTTGLEQRALTAARTIAAAHGLACDEAAVVSSGSNVLVHLRPAPVVARVMTGTVALHDDPRRWLQREVSVVSFLASSGVAIEPSPLIAPGPYRHDGLWMTCVGWIADVEPRAALDGAERLGHALRDLHDALRAFGSELGDMAELRDDIRRLHRLLEPTVDLSTERLASLRARLDRLDDVVFATSLPTQALHGDASLSNLLHVGDRLIFNDFEDTLRGPVHWDLAGYMVALRARGATPDFVARALHAYGWDDERELAPFTAAHAVYDEIWRLYDRQRRSV